MVRRCVALSLLLAIGGCAATHSAPGDGGGKLDLAPGPPDLARDLGPGPPDLLPTIPTLVELVPSDNPVGEGVAFTITVRFADKYFFAQPVTITLSSSDGNIITVPPSADLQFNQAEVPFKAAALAVGQATITATVAGMSAMATVNVIPSVASLDPSPLRIETGKSAMISVTLSGPALAGGHDVALASADVARVTVPASVHVAQGATSASVAVNAIAQGGPVTITASLAASAQSAPVYSVTPVSKLVISEVLYDALGPDDQYEWVEIYNGGTTDEDLSNYFLGVTPSSMSNTYSPSTPSLSGMVLAGECVVVGGPLADPMANSLIDGFVYLDPVPFNPALPNGLVADSEGLALFLGVPVPNKPVDLMATPIVDAVIYGALDRGLADETGDPGTLDVDYVPFPNQSLERIGPSAWRVQPKPNGGLCDWLHL